MVSLLAFGEKDFDNGAFRTPLRINAISGEWVTQIEKTEYLQGSARRLALKTISLEKP